MQGTDQVGSWQESGDWPVYCMRTAGLNAPGRIEGQNYSTRGTEAVFRGLKRYRMALPSAATRRRRVCSLAVREAAMYRRLLTLVVLSLALCACVPYYPGYGGYRSEVYVAPAPYGYGGYGPYYGHSRGYYAPPPRYYQGPPRYHHGPAYQSGHGPGHGGEQGQGRGWDR